MSHILSKNEIKLLCGSTSYQRGLTYYNANRVVRLSYDPNESQYHAVVKGSKQYRVNIMIDNYGDVEADCDCPAFDSYYDYCKHIAAVLLNIHDHNQKVLQPQSIPAHQFDIQKQRNSRESDVFKRDRQLANTMISLFDRTAVHNKTISISDQGQTVDIEFICKAIYYSSRKNRFTIEMKLGTKRLYVVQKIKEFLSSVESGTPYTFSKNFTWDPTIHTFKESDWEIIQQLIEIKHNELAFLESLNTFYSKYEMSSERAVYIPPMAFQTLLPKLSEASVRLEHGTDTYEGIEITQDPFPFTFQLNKAANKGYQLAIHGLDRVAIMDNYHVALVDGKLHKINQNQIHQLSELKQIFQNMPERQVRIDPTQIEPLIERVIPTIKKLAHVRIDPDISDRIVQPSLSARLYLDKDDDRLMARLEYVYDDMIIDPFRMVPSNQDRRERILIRDIEQESQIMALIERSALMIHGGNLYIDNEEDMYDFLFHSVPEIREWVDVFVTPGLKSVIHSNTYQPKVSMDVNSNTDWMEIRFEIEGIDQQEIRNILQMIVEKKKYYRLQNGTFLSLEEDGFFEIGKLMDEISLRKSEIKGTNIELPTVRGFQLMDTSEKLPSVKVGKSLRQLFQNMKHPDNLDFEIPKQLDSILRDYQKYGYQWMKTLSYYHFGGILADDMGLGKTLQSIAYILSEVQDHHTAGSPVLIVSPASLIYNWKNELKKFAPELQATVVAGDKQERFHIINDVSNMDVIITSYPLLRRDLEFYKKHRFRILILDEAQAIKNHATQTAQAVKDIQAHHRFALTGTPVENSLEELWSIFDAVFPGLFSSKKEFTELSREHIAKRVRPFILRRMKTDVLKELPEKIETLQSSELSTDQKKLYMAYLTKLQQETLQQLETDGFQKNRMKILAGLTRLRQLCCHPSLFIENYNGTSGKLEQLMEVVEECLSSGKRMLIFSQFTEMLNIIRQELGERNLSSFYLDGKTPSHERVELCRRFNEGEQDIFLISLKAGGTGLNLTGADTVILYDLWWNPAVEQQAADRAHRIGQKKVVQVLRLVTQGTIEEKMYELQQQKKDLIDAVIQPGEQSLSALTEKEIRELLMIS